MTTATTQPDPDLTVRSEPSSLPGRRVIAGAIWLIALTLLAYLPALNAGYIWDDDQYIVENRTLRTTEGLSRIWLEPTSIPQYYPLVHTTYWVEHQLWGIDPLGYHMVNAVIHALAATMLWLVLRRLKIPGAYLAALVFAVHPVHVESVAWVTERKNTLSALMYLWSGLVLLPFFGIRRNQLHETGSPKPWPINAALASRYALGMLLFVAALLSKSVTASLPAAMLLVIYWKYGRIRFRDVAWLLPFFVVGVAAGLHTAWLEKTHVGAEGTDFDLSFIQRLLIASRAICFYAWSVVWPSELTFFYERWHVDPRVWWQWLFPAGLLAVIITPWLARHRLGRGPIVAVCFFCGTLFPALGFIDVYPMKFSFVADHFQYHANIGLIALLVGGGAWLVQHRSSTIRSAAMGSFAGLVLMFTLITAAQCRVYEDKPTLYRDVLRKNPTAAIAYTNLGVWLTTEAKHVARQGQSDQAQAMRLEALDLLKQGYLLEPDNISVWNLGHTYVALREYDKAVALYEKALRMRPGLDMRLVDYARLLKGIGREQEAIAAYLKITRASPVADREAELVAHIELAALLLTADDPALRNREKALECAEYASNLTRGNSPLALRWLGAAQQANGQKEAAIETLERGARLASMDQQRFGGVLAEIEAELHAMQRETDRRAP